MQTGRNSFHIDSLHESIITEAVMQVQLSLSQPTICPAYPAGTRMTPVPHDFIRRDSYMRVSHVSVMFFCSPQCDAH